SAECGVLWLEGPRDERRETAGLFLQLVDTLEVIGAMDKVLTDAEHHCRRGAHAKLMRRAVNGDPVLGQALQTGDAMADLVIQYFRAAAGDGIETGVTQAHDGVAQRKLAIFRDGQYL